VRETILAFRLAGSEYGIDLLKVLEIRNYEAVTQIANLPAYIKGVIDLRGTIAPIIDLRIKFDQAQPIYGPQTVVIIVDLGRQTAGIVVDGVSDVVTLAPEQIRSSPMLANDLDSGYLRGIGAFEGRMLMLVDIEKLIEADQLALLDSSDLSERLGRASDCLAPRPPKESK